MISYVSYIEIKKLSYNLFFKHPEEKGMTYIKHLSHALVNSLYLFVASVCLILHGLVPLFFDKTGSSIVKKVYRNFNLDKDDKDNKKKE